MNTLNRLEFIDGIVAYYFNDDVNNHILSSISPVFNLSYEKCTVKKSNWTYEQWLSKINEVKK